MSRFEAVFFEEKDKVPVSDFLKGQTRKVREKLYRFISILEEKGHNMPYAYAEKLTHSEVWELKIPFGKNEYRIFYFYDHEKIVLVHTLIKKTNQTPLGDLDLAEKRRKQYLKQKGESE